MISGINSRDGILNAGGGTREEGERGQDSRRLQAGEGVASAARSHDRTREEEETKVQRRVFCRQRPRHLGCGVKPSQPSCRPLGRNRSSCQNMVHLGPDAIPSSQALTCEAPDWRPGGRVALKRSFIEVFSRKYKANPPFSSR